MKQKRNPQPSGIPYPALLAFAAFSLLTVGCGNSSRKTLRVGVNPWPGYGFLYLAEEKGFFRQTGVHVKLVDFESLPDARRAFENGKVDGIATTIVELLIARDESPRDIRIFRVFDYSDGADVIVAGKEIKSPLELRGKRVGVELASVGIYMLGRGLEKSGLGLKDVKVVSSDQGKLSQKLLEKEVDAIVTYPPYDAVTLSDKSRFHVIFSSSNIPGEVLDILAFDMETVRQHPREIEAFQKAVDLAFDYFRNQPEDACRLMAQALGIKPDDFTHQISKGIRLVDPKDNAAYLQPGGKVQETVRKAAHNLRQMDLLSGNPQLENCLPSP